MKPVLLSFFAYTSFALMDVINKFIFSSYYVLTFFQYMLLLDISIIGFLIFFGLYIHKFNFKFLYTKQKKGIAIRSIISVINTLCSLVAIAYLPLHLFYALAFLQPMFAVGFSILMGFEKINKYKVLFITLAFIGIMISIEFWNKDYLNIELIGILAGIGIAISGALSGIVVKKYLSHENTITIAFYNILLSIMVASIYLLLSTSNPLNNVDSYLTILIILAGFFCSIGIILFMKSYQKGSVQSIAILQYTQSIWGIVFGYFIFQNFPSIFAIIGIILIIMANIFNLKLGQHTNVKI